MNAPTIAASARKRHPNIHLLVAPTGHELALAETLAQDAALPILAWRRAAGALHLLPDAMLDDVLRQRLEAGHTVCVWHGAEALDLTALHLRLGKNWVALSEHLQWASLSPSAGPPSATQWAPLAERLNRPDEADIRLFLASNGEQAPCWTLPEALNAQGQAAFDAWTQQHLAPHLEAWQIDDAQADKNQAPSLEAEAENTLFDWPWQASPTWEAMAWMPETLAAPNLPPEAPANDQRYRLKAASSKGTGARGGSQALAYVARLYPTDHLYEADRLQPYKPGGSQSGAHPLGGETAIVKIKQHTGALGKAYGVWLTLPTGITAEDRARPWCLWLHPAHRLPLPLVLRPQPGVTEHLLNWPERPCHQTSQELWADIIVGSVSLEML